MQKYSKNGFPPRPLADSQPRAGKLPLPRPSKGYRQGFDSTPKEKIFDPCPALPSTPRQGGRKHSGRKTLLQNNLTSGSPSEPNGSNKRREPYPGADQEPALSQGTTLEMIEGLDSGARDPHTLAFDEGERHIWFPVQGGASCGVAN